jgi:hypothetical protein
MTSPNAIFQNIVNTLGGTTIVALLALTTIAPLVKLF